MADYQITFIVISKMDLKKDLWIVVKLEKNLVTCKFKCFVTKHKMKWVTYFILGLDIKKTPITIQNV
jgi:hypothetical protein